MSVILQRICEFSNLTSANTALLQESIQSSLSDPWFFILFLFFFLFFSFLFSFFFFFFNFLFVFFLFVFLVHQRKLYQNRDTRCSKKERCI